MLPRAVPTLSKAVLGDGNGPLFRKGMHDLGKVGVGELVPNKEYYIPKPGSPGTYFGPLVFSHIVASVAEPYAVFHHVLDGLEYQSRVETLKRSGGMYVDNKAALQKFLDFVGSYGGDFHVSDAGVFRSLVSLPSIGDKLGVYSDMFGTMIGPVTVVGINYANKLCTLLYHEHAVEMPWDVLQSFRVVRLDDDNEPIGTFAAGLPIGAPAQAYVPAAERERWGPEWLQPERDRFGRVDKIIRTLKYCSFQIEVLAIDFDRTTITFHSFGEGIRSVGDIVRRGGPQLVNFASKSVLPNLVKMSPIPIYFVSFGVHEVVLEYVRAFNSSFPADHVLTPSMVGGTDGHVMANGKNTMLEAIASRERKPRASVCLIDDEKSNVEWARKAGFNGIAVSPGKFTDDMWLRFVVEQCAVPEAKGFVPKLYEDLPDIDPEIFFGRAARGSDIDEHGMRGTKYMWDGDELYGGVTKTAASKRRRRQAPAKKSASKLRNATLKKKTLGKRSTKRSHRKKLHKKLCSR